MTLLEFMLESMLKIIFKHALRLLHRDGNIIYANMTVGTVPDLHQGNMTTIGTVKDITERKMAELALQEYQQQLVALYTDAHEQNQQLALLHRISMAVNSTLDLPTLLTAACQQLVENFHADHSGMLLFDDKYSYGEVAAEFPAQGAIGIRIPLEGYTATLNMIATAQPCSIYDAQHDPTMEKVWAVMEALGICSILIVPMVIKGRVIGSFSLDITADQRYFEPDEIELTQTIATQLAMAIDNARLLERERTRLEQELETARRIQVSMLPLADPKITGLEIAGVSKSTRQVGGDFYNYFMFEPTFVGIAVGDVSGKGMEAALMMSLSVGLLTNEVHQINTPSRLLASLNNSPYAEMDLKKSPRWLRICNP